MQFLKCLLASVMRRPESKRFSPLLANHQTSTLFSSAVSPNYRRSFRPYGPCSPRMLNSQSYGLDWDSSAATSEPCLVSWAGRGSRRPSGEGTSWSCHRGHPFHEWLLIWRRFLTHPSQIWLILRRSSGELLETSYIQAAAVSQSQDKLFGRSDVATLR
jgi:hypothetical protein